MSPPISFADLGVPDDLVAVLKRQCITTPFDIQVAAIPDALDGRDVLGRAPTGSGKTLAFGLPLIANLPKAKSRRPAGLILSPTRELAEQIRRELEPLAQARQRSVLAVYGGVGFGNQLRALRAGVDLVVACPGRLMDLIDQGELSLDAVQFVVVDEADRMADMGFLPEVRKILDQTNSDRQTVMFSATLGREVKVLTDHYQDRPVTHQVGEVEPDLSLVTHRFIKTDRPTKVALAATLINETGPSMVFCRTRHGVDRVARQLKNAGVKSGWIHGGRSQNQRDNALDAFTRGKVDVLVATDVAARGIHVDGVACVIHFDPPEDDKAYVHRSGRTARAGASGVVISIITSEQVKATGKLQHDMGLDRSIEDTPPIDHDALAKARPAPDASNGQHSNRGNRSRNRGSSKRHGGQRSNGKGAANSSRANSNGGGKPSDSRRRDDESRPSRDTRPSKASKSKRHGKPRSGSATRNTSSGNGNSRGSSGNGNSGNGRSRNNSGNGKQSSRPSSGSNRGPNRQGGKPSQNRRSRTSR